VAQTPKVLHHLPRAIKRVLQKHLIDLPHQPQRRGTLAPRLVEKLERLSRTSAHCRTTESPGREG
jgi:hypothetical protein